MATRYRVLGQKSPAANTDWDIYTVNGTKDAVVSSITVANRDSGDSATYRIAVRPDGATLTNDMYVAYDVQVNASSTTSLSLGITLNQNDVLTVRSSSGLVSFNVFGTEIDV
jgi:hypothetical protein